MKAKKKAELIVALDVDTFEEARELIDSLSEVVDIFKVGNQLFTSCGPVAVRFLQARGKRVFLDLKYYDIPNTVANAVRTAVGLSAAVNADLNNNNIRLKEDRPSVFMYTLHIQGGEEMLKKAVEEGAKQAKLLGVKRPFTLGITVLTSEIKTDNIHGLVLQRALLAHKAGLDGVVASSEEAPLIRKNLGEKFIIVTPGIRPQGAEQGDQKRVATPQAAIKNGSDFLVVGRPIVQAQDPLKAAKDILKEIA